MGAEASWAGGEARLGPDGSCCRCAHWPDQDSTSTSAPVPTSAWAPFTCQLSVPALVLRVVCRVSCQ